eukprot:COSAG04_NODE_6334_length_1354_cov_1.098805_1_plen_229_part_00
MATPRSRRRQRQVAARHQQQQQQQRKQQQEPASTRSKGAPPARTPSPAEDGEELLFGSPPSSPASEPASPSSGVLKSFAAVPLAEVEDKTSTAEQPSSDFAGPSDFAEVLRLLAQQGSLFEASPEEHLKEDPPSTRRQPSGRAEPSLAEVEVEPMSAEMSSIWREETGAGGSQFGWVPAPPQAYVPHNQLLQQQVAAAAYHHQLYHQHQMHLQEYQQQQQQQVVPVHC